ncbi:hypothetical protein ACFPRL_01745 [Pseudoclavibacter helvolus]
MQVPPRPRVLAPRCSAVAPRSARRPRRSTQPQIPRSRRRSRRAERLGWPRAARGACR